MKISIKVILLLASAVCFGVAAFFPGPGRVNLIALGLCTWVLTELIPLL